MTVDDHLGFVNFFAVLCFGGVALEKLRLGIGIGRSSGRLRLVSAGIFFLVRRR